MAQHPQRIQKNTNTHDLDITKYSLEEVFDIFNLGFNITEEDLKQAKKKVLMIHPDKSKLSPDYFIFYKKAYEIIYQYYNTNLKYNSTQAMNTPVEAQQYNAKSGVAYNKSLHSAINDFSKGGGNLNNHINEVYEQNFQRVPNEKKNDWLKNDISPYAGIGGVSAGNINSKFADIKKKQAEMSMVQYRGVQTMYNMGGTVGGTSFYDDESDDDGGADGANYISCDPFSKLKYDDLRKVHKDQTVLGVSEHDYDKIRRYKDEKEFIAERGKNITPLEKMQAEKMLEIEHENYRRRMAERQYNATLRYAETDRKMQEVSSRFLQLKN